MATGGHFGGPICAKNNRVINVLSMAMPNMKLIGEFMKHYDTLAGTPPDWRYCQINSIRCMFKRGLVRRYKCHISWRVCKSGISWWVCKSTGYPGVCARAGYPGECAGAGYPDGCARAGYPVVCARAGYPGVCEGAGCPGGSWCRSGISWRVCSYEIFWRVCRYEIFWRVCRCVCADMEINPGFFSPLLDLM